MIFLVVFQGLMAMLGLFVTSRMYVGVRDRRLDVRGISYSWRQTPVSYGLVMLALTIGAVGVWSVVAFSVTILVGEALR